MKIDGFEMSPTFNSNNTTYQIKVPASTTSVNILATKNHNAATITGDGTATLTGNNTTKIITVKAEDGTEKKYTINIIKDTSSNDSENTDNPGNPNNPENSGTSGNPSGELPKSNDSTLKSIVVSGFDISPAFDPNVTSYDVKVPTSISNVIINASKNNDKSTVNGVGNINLTGNTTTHVVTVKAEDGTVRKYTINVIKDSSLDDVGSENKKSSDAKLKTLSAVNFPLNPSFNSNANNYIINVPNTITSLPLEAIANNPNAKVTIVGNNNFNEGNNPVLITVMAEDGTTNTYTINVIRAFSSNSTTKPVNKSSDNYLKTLVINSVHEINPAFNKNTSNYDITVPYEVDHLNINAIKNDSSSKIEIVGNENFKVGSINVIQIMVEAEDGSIRVYTLNVKRSTYTSKTSLSSINVGNGNIYPTFDSNISKYSVTVGSNVDKLDIMAIPLDKDSKVEIIGNENLKEGKNTVFVKVTDANGFEKYYELSVTKEDKKNTSTFMGLSPWLFWLIFSLFLLMLIIVLVLLLTKKEKNVPNLPNVTNEKPINIEFKPEINLGSKNTSDDDVIHGNYIQSVGSTENPKQILDAKYEDIENSLPYDPYDDIVTKKELLDAIYEARETKNPEKLKMLLDQEALNKKKEELKRREEEQKK